MYIPSLNEFATLNYRQKVHIVENIQNIIEAQKKNYLKNNNNDILISSYHPKNKYSNDINTRENDLSSSISSDEKETQNEKYIIEKAKNNILNFKRDFEEFKTQFQLFKANYERNNDKLRKTIPDEEINYIIETTNANNDDDSISYNNNYNYYYKNYKYNENSKNNANSISKIPFNYSTIYTYHKNIITKKQKTKNKKNINDAYNHRSIKSSLGFNSSYNITKSIPSKNNKKIIESQSKISHTKSSANINNRYECDNTNNIENIKKKLNFSKISNSKINKGLMRTISNTHRQGKHTKETSNRLYNMHEIIKEKINKKKKEFEEEEMKNCSFAPKINNKSKKIVQNIVKKGNNNRVYKKINLYKFLNKK